MIGLLLTGGAKLGAFAKSPFGRRVLLLVAVVAAFWWYGEARFRAGVAHEKATEAARLAKVEKKARTVEKKSDAITSSVSTVLETTKTEIRWRTRVQLQEVTRYVPIESDRACIVGVGALRLHDHALAGRPGVPEAPGGPIEADSGVHLSEVIADDVAFAGTAYEWRAEAVAWRRWYADQADLWTQNYGATQAR